jgi:hypothetical protein
MTVDAYAAVGITMPNSPNATKPEPPVAPAPKKP